MISGRPGPPAFSKFLYGLLGFGGKLLNGTDTANPNCGCPIATVGNAICGVHGVGGGVTPTIDKPVLGLRVPCDGGPNGVKLREGADSEGVTPREGGAWGGGRSF